MMMIMIHNNTCVILISIDIKNCAHNQQEVLSFIEERLTELEQEKAELTEYEQLDKARRALEYTLYDQELSKATVQLKELEEVRNDEREKQQQLFSNLGELQDQIQVLHSPTYQFRSHYPTPIVE